MRSLCLHHGEGERDVWFLTQFSCKPRRGRKDPPSYTPTEVGCRPQLCSAQPGRWTSHETIHFSRDFEGKGDLFPYLDGQRRGCKRVGRKPKLVWAVLKHVSTELSPHPGGNLESHWDVILRPEAGLWDVQLGRAPSTKHYGFPPSVLLQGRKKRPSILS